MKVKELIRQLKGYNPQARVIVDKGYEGDYDYVDYVGWSYNDDGETDKRLVKLRQLEAWCLELLV